MIMSRETTDYLKQLLSLMPRGAAWTKEVGSRWYEFWYGASDELARLEDRSQVLITERDSRYTTELIEEHEVDFGVPETCVVDGVPFDPVMTLSERRKRIHAKLLATGQQDKSYFIEVAENYGFSSSITEYAPAWCGLLLCDDPIGDLDSLFHWSFNINFSGDLTEFLCGEGTSGQALRKATDLLEAVFCYADRYKPAHTIMIPAVIGPPFDRAFDTSFHSLPSSEENVYGAFDRGFTTAFSKFLGGDFSYDAFGQGFFKPL